ncbi:hypothetical protein Tco_1199684, partial [Tanacetum coccineum]
TGKLYMWGNAKDGQLGVPGVPEIQPFPIEVKFLRDDDGFGFFPQWSFSSSHAISCSLLGFKISDSPSQPVIQNDHLKVDAVVALKELGLDNVTGVEVVESLPLVVRADPHNFPFFDEVFGLGFSSFLDQALFPVKYVREIERCVKVGGVIVLCVEVCGDEGVTDVVELFRKSTFSLAENVTLMGTKMTMIVMERVKDEQPRGRRGRRGGYVRGQPRQGADVNEEEHLPNRRDQRDLEIAAQGRRIRELERMLAQARLENFRDVDRDDEGSHGSDIDSTESNNEEDENP